MALPLSDDSPLNEKTKQALIEWLLPPLRQELIIQRELTVAALKHVCEELFSKGVAPPSNARSGRVPRSLPPSTDTLHGTDHTQAVVDGSVRWDVSAQPSQRTDHSRATHQTQECCLEAMTEEPERPSRRSLFRKSISLTSSVRNLIDTGMVVVEPMSENGSLQVTPRSRLSRTIHSWQFRLVMSLVIFANTIVIGFTTDYEVDLVMQGTQRTRSYTWIYLERSFTAVFTIEILFRIIAEGTGFLFGEIWMWNLFDAGLVVQALVVACLDYMGNTQAANLSFVRVLRVLRFSRVLRLVQVIRVFKGFATMVHSMLHSMVSLLWVFLMLLFVLYFFAIIILQGIAADFNKLSPHDDSVRQKLQDSYGSISKALLSLFMVITGGEDWSALYAPLATLGWVYGGVFIFYMYFVVFGMLNLVTSVFVDASCQEAMRDRNHAVSLEIDRKRMYIDACAKFFMEIKKKRAGQLAREEFEECLQNEKMRAYATHLELDETQASTLFTLLDVNGSNSVSEDRFIEGCERLRGGAKSVDVNMLLYQNDKMIKIWLEFMKFTEAKLEAIDVSLDNAPDPNPAQCSDDIDFGAATTWLDSAVNVIQQASREREFRTLCRQKSSLPRQPVTHSVLGPRQASMVSIPSQPGSEQERDIVESDLLHSPRGKCLSHL